MIEQSDTPSQPAPASAIATEFVGIFESLARVMRSGEELTPKVREDIASFMDRAASSAKILAVTLRAVR